MIAGWDLALRMPGPLKLLHGERSTPRELIWVYAGALAFTGVFHLAFRADVASLEPARLVLLILVALNLAGGAIANLSAGTRFYWRSKPASVRMCFLAVHGVHAAALAFIFPGLAPAALLAWTWMMGAGALLTLGPRTFQGDAPAMALALGGSIALKLVPGASPAADVLLALFLLKLVFGFCSGGSGSRPAAGGHPD